MGPRLRSYAGDADLARVIDLLLACRRAGYVDMELRSIELRILLRSGYFPVERWTLIVEDEAGEWLAFAMLWQGTHLAMLVHPSVRGRVEGEVLGWAAETVRRDGGAELWALCRDDDRFGCELLEEQGFAVGDTELRMGRSLDLPVPDPIVPQGFRIRGLNPDRELDDWLAMYAETIGEREHALRKWRAIRAEPDYEPGLDLVAVAPDGGLAGACTCIIARVEAEHDRRNDRLSVGRTEPIMVRASYRRRGIGSALVLTGLRLLQVRGMDLAMLTTEPDNIAAHRIYESLGYRTLYSARFYRKALV